MIKYDKWSSIYILENSGFIHWIECQDFPDLFRIMSSLNWQNLIFDNRKIKFLASQILHVCYISTVISCSAMHYLPCIWPVLLFNDRFKKKKISSLPMADVFPYVSCLIYIAMHYFFLMFYYSSNGLLTFNNCVMHTLAAVMCVYASIIYVYSYES